MNKVITLLLLLCSIFFLFVHWKGLSSKPDLLAQAKVSLREIEEIIPKGSTIHLKGNLSNYRPFLQFDLAPLVLLTEEIPKKDDYILVVARPGRERTFKGDFLDTLYHKEDHYFIIELYKQL